MDQAKRIHQTVDEHFAHGGSASLDPPYNALVRTLLFFRWLAGSIVINVTRPINGRFALTFQFLQIQAFVPPHRSRFFLILFDLGFLI